jgi:hypothetical protein
MAPEKIHGCRRRIDFSRPAFKMTAGYFDIGWRAQGPGNRCHSTQLQAGQGLTARLLAPTGSRGGFVNFLLTCRSNNSNKDPIWPKAAGIEERAMDTAWIQVFVLTLSECLAPAGKTVCQEQELQMQFVDQAECELALQQLVALKEGAANVIVYKDKSHCAPSARQQSVYKSLKDVNEKLGTTPDWMAPEAEEPPADVMQSSHQQRLTALSSCEDVGGVAPCKIGEIIIEGATEQSVDVWRREQ